jgi:hypothetical protein
MGVRKTGTTTPAALSSGRLKENAGAGAVQRATKKEEPPLAGSDLIAWRQQFIFPNQETSAIPCTVGARNPYAVAERIAMREDKESFIEWIENHENPEAWIDNRPLLMSNLEKLVAPPPGVPHPDLVTLEYRNLFDPGLVPNSPLYRFTLKSAKPSPLSKNASESFAEKISGAPLRSRKTDLARVASSAVNVEAMILSGNEVRTEANPCADLADTATQWAKCPIPGTTTTAFYCRKISGAPGEIIDDVVQGCALNCYFIAALASVAWVKYPNFPPACTQTLQDSYSIKFYYLDGTYYEKPIESTIPLNAANYSIFCRPSTAYETWPSIYEKAYGDFLGLPKWDALTNNGKEEYEDYPRPTISSFGGGNPLLALQHLTGVSWENTYYNCNREGWNGTGTSFATLNNAMVYYGSSGCTRYPAVAYTYETAEEANAAHPNNPITYADEIIVANHSYSILGTMKDGGNNYVVLRNPYGRLHSADPDDSEFKNYLFMGKWAPKTNFYRYMTVVDGIFALRADKFELYFKTFGWVPY